MPVPQNAKAIYSLLTAAGLSPNAAAGILGNIEQESGGNPSAGNYPANYGLIQWTPANQSGYTVPRGSSVATQVTYIIKYIEANGSIADINTHSPTPSAAALYFSTNYERPLASAANNPNRESSAEAVAVAASSGNWPQAAGLTSDTSAGTSGGILGIPSEITGAFTDFDTILKDILSPGFWLRIGAFFAGVGLLIAGIWCLMHASDDSSLIPDLSKLPPVPVPV